MIEYWYSSLERGYTLRPTVQLQGQDTRPTVQLQGQDTRPTAQLQGQKDKSQMTKVPRGYPGMYEYAGTHTGPGMSSSTWFDVARVPYLPTYRLGILTTLSYKCTVQFIPAGPAWLERMVRGSQRGRGRGRGSRKRPS